MVRAAATLVGGLGVTIGSTFASALGLSIGEQRIGFGIGVLMVAVAAGLFLYDVRKRRADAEPEISPAPSTKLMDPEKMKLADDLARLHSQGVSIRDRMRPVFGTEFLGHLTDRVRQWDGSVRNRLQQDAPRELFAFNAEQFPELIPTQLNVQAGPAERKRLVEFMDRRLGVLAGIIEEVRL